MPAPARAVPLSGRAAHLLRSKLAQRPFEVRYPALQSPAPCRRQPGPSRHPSNRGYPRAALHLRALLAQLTIEFCSEDAQVLLEHRNGLLKQCVDLLVVVCVFSFKKV